MLTIWNCQILQIEGFPILLSLFIVWVSILMIQNCPILQIVGLKSAHQITFMANWRVHSWSTLRTHLDNIWNTFVTHLEQISSTLWTNWKDFCNTSLQCWWNQEDVVVQSIFVGKIEVCVVLNCKSSSRRNTLLVRGAFWSGERTWACSLCPCDQVHSNEILLHCITGCESMSL